MPIPEFFKYDIRVRERMLKRGMLTDSELGKHVDALSDVADQVIEVELKAARASEGVGARGAHRQPFRNRDRSWRTCPSCVRWRTSSMISTTTRRTTSDDEDDVKVKAAAKVVADKAAAEPKVEAAAEPSVASESKKAEADDEGWSET